MNPVSPIAPCPAPDCEASPTTQVLIGHWPDGCPRFECQECSVEWSWHQASTLCPMDTQCHQVPEAAAAQSP